MAILIWTTPAGVAQISVGDRDPGFVGPTLLNGSAPGKIKAMVHTGAGTIIVGDFTSVNGVPRGRIARLLPDGSLDTNFATGSGANGAINAVAYAGDHYVIGGEFSRFDDLDRTFLARVLASTGRVDGNYATAGPNGVVHAIVADASSCYIGGEFTQVGSVVRNGLAYLNGSTGAPIATFNPSPGADGPVYSLARPDRFTSMGDFLFVGGAFTHLNGQKRNRIAAISASSGTLRTFDPNGSGANGPVLTVQVGRSVTNGQLPLYIGGAFTAVSGLGRANIARYNVSSHQSMVDPSFAPYTNGPVRAIVEPTPVQLVIAGDFTTVNSIPKRHVARLSAATPGSYSYYFPSTAYNLDMTFGSGSGPDGPVHAMSLAADGKVVIAGDFAEVDGVAAPSVARLYGSAGSAPPAVSRRFSALGVSPTRAYLEWDFVSYASGYRIERRADGESEWKPVNVTSTTYVDIDLQPGTTYHYRVRAVNTNGVGEPTEARTARTLAEEWTGAGAVDTDVTPPLSQFSGLETAALLPDGRIIITGYFTEVRGVPRARIAVLLPDLTLDTSFDPGTGANSSVTRAIPTRDGKIVIHGYFTSVAGVERNSLALLNPDGTLDPTFAPELASSTWISSLDAQSDGRVLLAGSFTSIGTVPVQYLARLNRDGTIDRSFAPTLNSSVSKIAIDSQDRILVAGNFTTVNGQPASGLVRLFPDGSTDSSFAVSRASSISSLALTTDGQIIIGGYFDSISGVPRSRLARLYEDGSLDLTFNPIAPRDGYIAVAPQTDGKVLVSFWSVLEGEHPRVSLARFSADGSVDPFFFAGRGSNSTPSTILPLQDGRLLIGGGFSTFDGRSIGSLVVLKGDSVLAPPPPPAGLAAVPLSSTALRVSWTDRPGETSWRLERSLNGADGWAPVAVLNWTSLAFHDTRLLPNTEYHYRLQAVNSAGASDYSSVVGGKTLSRFTQWKVNQGFARSLPEEDDGDRDGIPLSLEYALGLDPAVASTDGMPVHQLMNGAIALSYRKQRAEVQYVVESSQDMITWSSSDVNQGTGSFPIAWSLIRDAPQKFLRLRVIVP